MKTVLLHIGIPKTGSTSIQAFLRTNSPALRRRGIACPLLTATGNATPLHDFALDDERPSFSKRNRQLNSREAIAGLRDTLPGLLKEKIEPYHDCNRFIFSAEGLSFLRHSTEFNRLASLLEPLFDHVEILVYLRRQDDLAVSRYSQSIQSGTTPPCIFPDSGSADFDNIYDYVRLLKAYESFTGKENIHVRRYGSKTEGFDSVTDFCLATSIDMDGLVTPKKSNTRISLKEIQFYQSFNERFTKEHQGHPNHTLRQHVRKALNGFPRNPSLHSDSVESRSFYALFKESNTWVARRYFNGDQLFPVARRSMFKPLPKHPADSVDTLSTEDALEIALLICEQMKKMLDVQQ